MTFLMDTHVFLWWVTDQPGVSQTAHDAITNPGNRLLLSAASGWEIAIKSALGRLELPASPSKFVPDQMQQNDFEVLPVRMYHALEVHALPAHHRDPFDRLLIAQSRSEGAPLISGDRALAAYDVDVVW
ncbi:MAG TPA: type II toxin-antitoxin system VapC family toxin [Candidatus Latescibacteria bacterium]|nr:type II toxin-antitoxin system VapC family toxin [Candidatus Latescibacterota bacterium]